MATNFGPCSPWTPVWSCDVSAESPAATGAAVAAATEVVWALSGRQFGTCSVTLRPCRQECFTGYGTWYWWLGPGYSPQGTLPFGSWWLPSVCGACTNTCSCTSLSQVDLPSPVHSIVSVKLDGSPMATGTSSYRLDEDRFLVRTDGQKWPLCNDLTKDDTQPGTWSITALYGQDVPVSGQLAVGELACEFLKAMRGEDCRLPPGVTSLARQGVTISMPDPGELMKEGRTGLYLVDSFVNSVNPHRLTSRSRVYSVDKTTHRRPS